MEQPAIDEATAYHEAGHAVASLALGRPVHAVSALPTRHYLGNCHFGKAVFRPSEDWLEREILISLGGIAAEAIHTGRYAWEEAERDFIYVRDLTRRRCGGNERQAERLERRMLTKAEHLLSRDGNWHAVELIARELMRVGEISGRAARHFFEQAQADR